MPMDRSKYAPDWEQISKRIRERDRLRCKQCGVRQYAVGQRDEDGRFVPIVGNLYVDDYQYTASYREAREVADHANTERETGEPRYIVIVLTVAHLNHDTADNRDENLAALCQQCHLRYDTRHHMANAASTRSQKRVAAGQLTLEVTT